MRLKYLILCLLLASCAKVEHSIKVYNLKGREAMAINERFIVLAGQSNAAGVGLPEEIQSDLVAPIKGAKVFTGPVTLDFTQYSWQQLQFGVNNEGTHGAYEGSSGRFGVELRLMKMLTDKYGKFNLVKVSKGGTPLHYSPAGDGDQIDWSPLSAGEMFDLSAGYETAAKTSVSRAPDAFVWIHGENDARSDWGPQYAANLTNKIAYERTFWNAPNMPVIICRLSNNQTVIPDADRNQIRAAQQSVATNVPNCYLVDMDGLPVYSDHIHYTGAGYDGGAHRIFNVLKKRIPLIVNRFVVPTTEVTFATAGVNTTNTRRIYEIGNPIKSFDPGRTINGIDRFKVGKTYYGAFSETVDLKDYIYNDNE